jgi:hypothetical protein
MGRGRFIRVSGPRIFQILNGFLSRALRVRFCVFVRPVWVRPCARAMRFAMNKGDPFPPCLGRARRYSTVFKKKYNRIILAVPPRKSDVADVSISDD